MAKHKNNQQSYLAVTSMNYNNYHYGNIFSKEKSWHLYPGDSQQLEDSIYSRFLRREPITSTEIS